MKADDQLDMPDATGRTSWWRNRRRMFYGVLAALPLFAFGGWTWWYRTDFPIPEAMSTQAFPLECRDKLLHWKLLRETRNLELEGTAWIDRESGTRIRFGEDSRLSWEFDSSAYEGSDREIWIKRKELYDGADYRRLGIPGRYAIGWIYYPDSLAFPSIDRVVAMRFDGEVLGIIYTEEYSANPTFDLYGFSLNLTREPDAEKAD